MNTRYISIVLLKEMLLFVFVNKVIIRSDKVKILKFYVQKSLKILLQINEEAS